MRENRENPSLPMLLLYYTCPNQCSKWEFVTNNNSNSRLKGKIWESFWQNNIQTDSVNTLKYKQKHTNYMIQNKVKASMKPKRFECINVWKDINSNLFGKSRNIDAYKSNYDSKPIQNKIVDRLKKWSG